MQLFYSFGILLLNLAIRIASFFNPKAKLWVDGRRNWKKNLILQVNQTNKELVWVHCASLGEFEQAKPLIELHKERYPAKGILLTFFSPSGYEAQKNYPLAEIVTYLPIDLPKTAFQFLHICKPSEAYFTKYEIWPNYLRALKKLNIPSTLFSANFRPGQVYFKSFGLWFRNSLKCFNKIYVQNQRSVDLLKKIGVSAKQAGDTRFDRVWETVKQNESVEKIADFKGVSKLLVAGSSWPADEKCIANIAPKLDCKLIIAPHEVDEKHLKAIEVIFPKSKRFSNYSGDQHLNVLIIDSIGLLSRIYKYADITYIGGGFGAGIHNTLEAAAFGCPIVFGPNYQKFDEAKILIELGAAKSFTSSSELKAILDLWLENSDKEKETARNFVKDNLGAAHKILD